MSRLAPLAALLAAASAFHSPVSMILRPGAPPHSAGGGHKQEIPETLDQQHALRALLSIRACVHCARIFAAGHKFIYSIHMFTCMLLDKGEPCTSHDASPLSESFHACMMSAFVHACTLLDQKVHVSNNFLHADIGVIVVRISFQHLLASHPSHRTQAHGLKFSPELPEPPRSAIFCAATAREG